MRRFDVDQGTTNWDECTASGVNDSFNGLISMSSFLEAATSATAYGLWMNVQYEQSSRHLCAHKHSESMKQVRWRS